MLSHPGSSTQPAVWSALWKVQVPRKFQIFCWRLLHGIVQLKGIRANMHIGTVSECLIYHQGAEDGRHLLFQCTHAKDLWKRLGLDDLISSVIHVDHGTSASPTI